MMVSECYKSECVQVTKSVSAAIASFTRIGPSIKRGATLTATRRQNAKLNIYSVKDKHKQKHRKGATRTRNCKQIQRQMFTERQTQTNTCRIFGHL